VAGFDFDAALGRVYSKHYSRLLAWAWKNLGRKEPAEDLVQNACIAALESKGRFRGEGDDAVFNFLLAIVGCDIKDAIRSRRRERKNARTSYSDFQDYSGEEDLTGKKEEELDDEEKSYLRKETAR